jgi:hypothetical protein
MKRIVLVLVSVSVTALALAGPAAAQTQGLHFTQGGEVVCQDVGTRLNCTGELAGVGNATLVATLNAPNATATNLICENKGGNQAPGQNPGVPTTAAGNQTLMQDKNGRAVIAVFAGIGAISPRDAGCPNGNWRVIVGDVEFGDYTLTIRQGNQVVVSCTGSFLPGASVNNEIDVPECTIL